MISRTSRAFAAAFVAAAAMLGCTAREREISQKPVLKINARQVDAKEFAERLAKRLKNYDALYAKDEGNLKRAKERTVEEFVLETATRDYARENKIVVEPKDIEAAAQSVRSRYPDDLAFRRSLAQENLSFEDWKKSLEFTLLQKKIFARISADAPAFTEAEMKAYYEQNKAQWARPARIRLRQIVLAKEEDAQKVADQLTANPAAMARLAKQFSIAPEGENGGDTGWIEKGTLEIFDQAFKLNVGARSKILKSPYGFHIFEVLAKEPETRLSFEAAKTKIRAQLSERREQTAFASWLEKQARKTKVFRDESMLESIKVTTREN